MEKEQTETTPAINKSTADEFQLPSWLANGEPIPDELLAKRSFNTQSTYAPLDDDDGDDDYDPYQPSSFYGFSFIDFSNNNEDTWSIRSSNAPSIVNANIREEMKTCVETLNTCLNQFREMNEQFNTNESNEPLDENIVAFVNDLI